MATIALRNDQLALVRQAHGLRTDREFAAAINMDAGVISRVQRGISAPGPRFVGSVLSRFEGLKFEDVFQVTAEAVSAEVAS